MLGHASPFPNSTLFPFPPLLPFTLTYASLLSALLFPYSLIYAFLLQSFSFPFHAHMILEILSGV